MNNPLVSIIIPVFNNEKYIFKSINSALEQTYNPIEIIIVNDGSTDRSQEITESFGDKVILINQENRGAGAARNTGLKNSKGVYVKFLDGDDILHKSAIEQQVAQSLSLGSRKAIVYGHYQYIDDFENVSIPKSYKKIHEWDDPVSFLILNDYIVTTCPLHKKEYLDEVGGFTEAFFPGEDPELHLKLFLNGVNIIYQDTLVYSYRQYSSSTRLSSVRWPNKKPGLGRLQLELYEKMIYEKFKRPKQTILRALGNKHYGYGIKLYLANNNSYAIYHFNKAKYFNNWYHYKISNRYWKGILIRVSQILFGKKIAFKILKK